MATRKEYWIVELTARGPVVRLAVGHERRRKGTLHDTREAAEATAERVQKRERKERATDQAWLAEFRKHQQLLAEYEAREGRG